MKIPNRKHYPLTNQKGNSSCPRKTAKSTNTFLLEVLRRAMATKRVATKAKKRMTQPEVIDHFSENTGMKRAQVKEFFEELYNLAAREVKSNGEFVLPGLGKLVKSERRAREGRNPASGESIQIPAKTTLKFRVGRTMKDTILPKKGGTNAVDPGGTGGGEDE